MFADPSLLQHRYRPRILFAWEPDLDALTPYRGEGAGTFARNSIATYVDSDGVIQQVSANQPRYQDGGILLEPQRTNSHTYSVDLTNAYWTKLSCSATLASIISPDGTLAGVKVAETGAGVSQRMLRRAVTISPSTFYTHSVYAKAGTLSWVMLSVRDLTGAERRSWFNLSSGTVGTVAAGVTATIEDAGSGWYRCSVSFDASTGASSGQLDTHITDADNTTAYDGDGTDYLYLWGFQFEAGSYATSYIPTAGASVTREADSLSFPFTEGLPAEGMTILQAGRFKIDPAASNIALGMYLSDLTTSATEWGLIFRSTGIARYYGPSGAATVDAVSGPTFTEDTEDDIVAQIDVANDTLRTFNASDVAQATTAIDSTSTHTLGGLEIQRSTGAAPFVVTALLIVRGLLTPSQMRSLLRA